MRDVWSHTVTIAIVVASLCSLIIGFSSDTAMLGCASAAIGMCFVGLRCSLNRARDVRPAVCEPSPEPLASPVTEPLNTESDESSALVHEMLLQGRYSLLLRPQIIKTLTAQQRARARDALDESMTVIPGGEVLVSNGISPEGEELKERFYVDAAYLDRYPVTNRQFQEFVVQGGYEQMSLWDAAIWPAVLDFVDQSGQPGPRLWENGQFRPGMEDHPVVGVSWFEACAYARWVGKRLPTDPEWIKAASWPVQASGDEIVQRRYPWGDTMDRARANLWGSAANQTCSVFEYADGVSVGGACHLVGNTWEWTTNNFHAWDESGHRLEMNSPMKTVRGGAYDTYFDNQACSLFGSGDSPMSRKHNIGFRCAIGICDLADGEEAEEDLEPVTSTTTS